MTHTEILDKLRHEGAEVYLTGSRAICPEVAEAKGSDWDYVVYFPQEEGVHDYLTSLGFEPQFDAEDDEDDEFAHYGGPQTWPWLRGDLNLIVTFHHDVLLRWKAATEEATRLGLKTRAERVACFHRILYQTREE